MKKSLFKQRGFIGGGITAHTHASGASGGNILQHVPAGTLIDYCGTVLPDGFLFCDGAAVSRVTYAALFANIGVTWGAGDGSTTFNVPDFRRRSTIGSGGTGTATIGNAVGNVGGEENHTLLDAEAPVMATPSGGTHVHNMNVDADGTPSGTAWEAQGRQNNTPTAQASGFTTVSGQGGHTHMVNSGGGGSHNTYHPCGVVQKIIKT